MKGVLWIFVGIVIGFLALAFFTQIPHSTSKTATLSLKNRTLVFEVVDTPETRMKGLGGRESLPEDAGMLFVFDTIDVHSFWMKDMLFPIDIIWLDSNFTVVHTEQNILPDTYPNVFTPTEKALYVLEVNSGVLSELDIEKGTRLVVVFK